MVVKAHQYQIEILALCLKQIPVCMFMYFCIINIIGVLIITVKSAQTITSYKMTTYQRGSMLSPPKRIPIQLLLYEMTTCLTQPATTFVVPKWKKLFKTATAKLYPAEKWEAMHEKYVSLIIFTLLLLYNAKFLYCL